MSSSGPETAAGEFKPMFMEVCVDSIASVRAAMAAFEEVIVARALQLTHPAAAVLNGDVAETASQLQVLMDSLTSIESNPAMRQTFARCMTPCPPEGENPTDAGRGARPPPSAGHRDQRADPNEGFDNEGAVLMDDGAVAEDQPSSSAAGRLQQNAPNSAAAAVATTPTAAAVSGLAPTTTRLPQLRLEVCSALAQGGLTPSTGFARQVHNVVTSSFFTVASVTAALHRVLSSKTGAASTTPTSTEVSAPDATVVAGENSGLGGANPAVTTATTVTSDLEALGALTKVAARRLIAFLERVAPLCMTCALSFMVRCRPGLDYAYSRDEVEGMCLDVASLGTAMIAARQPLQAPIPLTNAEPTAPSTPSTQGGSFSRADRPEGSPTGRGQQQPPQQQQEEPSLFNRFVRWGLEVSDSMERALSSAGLAMDASKIKDPNGPPPRVQILGVVFGALTATSNTATGAADDTNTGTTAELVNPDGTITHQPLQVPHHSSERGLDVAAVERVALTAAQYGWGVTLHRAFDALCQSVVCDESAQEGSNAEVHRAQLMDSSSLSTALAENTAAATRVAAAIDALYKVNQTVRAAYATATTEAEQYRLYDLPNGADSRQVGVRWILTSGALTQSIGETDAVRNLVHLARLSASRRDALASLATIEFLAGSGVTPQSAPSIVPLLVALESGDARDSSAAYVHAHFSAKEVIHWQPASESYWRTSQAIATATLRRAVFG
jgi:copper homeostasis protein CutC